ncbi:hypothetical protein IFR05_001687 [Cadophora sp. M221]|nr:hypothetical protein IFR05_001687 [Cadophora sp. M221]
MNPWDASLPNWGSMFGHYQLDGNSRSQSYEENIPQSPFSNPPVFPNHGLPSTSQASPASPPVSELAAFSLRSPKCPHCKGKRFDFRAYFHNPKFFRAPPHELLNLVERSYVLRNRLQSLLVTYIVNDLREDHRMQDVRADIIDWVRQVSNLSGEIREGMNQVDGVSAGLAGVEAWTEGMANSLGEHLDRSNGMRMEVPKGWMREILSDFRKQWEKVWISCANACAYRQGLRRSFEQNRGLVFG